MHVRNLKKIVDVVFKKIIHTRQQQQKLTLLTTCIQLFYCEMETNLGTCKSFYLTFHDSMSDALSKQEKNPIIGYKVTASQK